MPPKQTANLQKRGRSPEEESITVAQGGHGGSGRGGVQIGVADWLDEDDPIFLNAGGNRMAGVRAGRPSAGRMTRSGEAQQSAYDSDPDYNPYPPPVSPRGGERRKRRRGTAAAEEDADAEAEFGLQEEFTQALEDPPAGDNRRKRRRSEARSERSGETPRASSYYEGEEPGDGEKSGWKKKKRPDTTETIPEELILRYENRGPYRGEQSFDGPERILRWYIFWQQVPNYVTQEQFKGWQTVLDNIPVGVMSEYAPIGEEFRTPDTRIMEPRILRSHPFLPDYLPCEQFPPILLQAYKNCITTRGGDKKPTTWADIVNRSGGIAHYTGKKWRYIKPNTMQTRVFSWRNLIGMPSDNPKKKAPTHDRKDPGLKDVHWNACFELPPFRQAHLVTPASRVPKEHMDERAFMTLEQIQSLQDVREQRKAMEQRAKRRGGGGEGQEGTAAQRAARGTTGAWGGTRGRGRGRGRGGARGGGTTGRVTVGQRGPPSTAPSDFEMQQYSASQGLDDRGTPLDPQLLHYQPQAAEEEQEIPFAVDLFDWMDLQPKDRKLFYQTPNYATQPPPEVAYEVWMNEPIVGKLDYLRAKYKKHIMEEATRLLQDENAQPLRGQAPHQQPGGERAYPEYAQAPYQQTYYPQHGQAQYGQLDYSQQQPQYPQGYPQHPEGYQQGYYGQLQQQQEQYQDLGGYHQQLAGGQQRELDPQGQHGQHEQDGQQGEICQQEQYSQYEESDLPEQPQQQGLSFEQQLFGDSNFLDDLDIDAAELDEMLRQLEPEPATLFNPPLPNTSLTPAEQAAQADYSAAAPVRSFIENQESLIPPESRTQPDKQSQDASVHNEGFQEGLVVQQQYTQNLLDSVVNNAQRLAMAAETAQEQNQRLQEDISWRGGVGNALPPISNLRRAAQAADPEIAFADSPAPPAPPVPLAPWYSVLTDVEDPFLSRTALPTHLEDLFSENGEDGEGNEDDENLEEDPRRNASPADYFGARGNASAVAMTKPSAPTPRSIANKIRKAWEKFLRVVERDPKEHRAFVGAVKVEKARKKPMLMTMSEIRQMVKGMVAAAA